MKWFETLLWAVNPDSWKLTVLKIIIETLFIELLYEIDLLCSRCSVSKSHDNQNGILKDTAVQYWLTCQSHVVSDDPLSMLVLGDQVFKRLCYMTDIVWNLKGHEIDSYY